MVESEEEEGRERRGEMDEAGTPERSWEMMSRWRLAV